MTQQVARLRVALNLRNDTGCDFFRPRYEVPAEKPAELTVTESAEYSSEQV